MKLESWGESQDHVVEDFCESHREAFDDWCKREAGLFIVTRKIIIGPVAFAFLTAWNYYKTGDLLALLPYALPFFLLSTITLSPHSFFSYARTILEILGITVVFGSILLLKIAASHAMGAANFPLQMALMLVVAISFQSSSRFNLIRAGLYVTFAIGVIVFWSGIPLSSVAIQLLTGPAAGLWLSNDTIDRRRHRFYAIVTNTRQMQHTYGELVKLVPPHVVSQIQRGVRLEDTMPSSPGAACVLSFDIVKSSKIMHPDAFAVISELKNKCYRVLKQGYDEAGLESNGYRIKDTGDGFLCSIGYPYRTPGGRPMVDVAHDLAEAFAAIFDQEMISLGLPVPPRCSIGIAMGEIRGFFPDEEPRQYDLHGRVIMLATRYEAMRNKLKEAIGRSLPHNVIFVQEQVWLGLSDERRSQYELWDCNTPERKIRDDPDAARAYYKFMTKPHVPAVRASLREVKTSPTSETQDPKAKAG